MLTDKTINNVCKYGLHAWLKYLNVYLWRMVDAVSVTDQLKVP